MSLFCPACGFDTPEFASRLTSWSSDLVHHACFFGSMVEINYLQFAHSGKVGLPQLSRHCDDKCDWDPYHELFPVQPYL
ncbi:hypothetical protein POVWA2_003060 [Plasmodium ovale wallikeri]|uniref:Uncharacterized protein n=1 Tax=Plasmodium ovale wallikeri TaxID=864142 RepID=A0A1A8YGE3_PLAOA|nr:hypothetical protein POVWA1_002890 [Plasmodium ovale wallikeri]SBT31234.1 hypothetical protein POVWA2_003060 [Plasmodium ovale wallikeri]